VSSAADVGIGFGWRMMMQQFIGVTTDISDMQMTTGAAASQLVVDKS
jgi:hypothetical protein